MTCLGVYERRKTALESQRRERHAVAGARLRMEALQDQLSRARQNTKEADHDDPEALSLRMAQIRKALDFETLTLPTPQAPAERLNDQDDKKDMTDDDIEQNVIPSSSTTLASSSSAAASPTKTGGLNSSNAFKSILAMLAQPWTEEREEYDDDDSSLFNDCCCCICLEPYQAGQVICSPTTNKTHSGRAGGGCDRHQHIFHETCAMQWFMKSDECPLCRTNIMALVVLHPDDVDGENDNDSIQEV
eukprot:CAMPEP_0113628956 /NCGR_PEP_ID=MMETSP0017_2-20120614/15017_1 /TAXON_ID=2856 /ORGANISM="Cylindrotheca closterium" /LENGTH=245 /DNA_ID=CAMNT_0000539307 /DNA_START=13 /DNA_END=750 /DNA_ORIENTATION=+ /assembly_acc=CAM_ASM_000147